MDSAIRELQEYLDDTARRCLRLIVLGKLTKKQMRRLAKFMFGCMNQKNELPRRVKLRGSGELSKVVAFATKACEVLLEIDPPFDENGG